MTITFTVNDSETVKASGAAIANPDAMKQACEHIKNRAQEHLLVFTFNTRRQVIGCHTISIGTVSASIVHPREVFRSAILDNASTIILAHNHPSGDATPSSADLEVTKKIAAAGTILGIELLDHLVVGETTTSLRAEHSHLFN